MRTSKPISTISYNTLPFLKEKLDDLVNNQVLEFYFFIWHHAEDDEAGKKITVTFTHNLHKLLIQWL